MSCLHSILCLFGFSKPTKSANILEFEGAGCVFTDNKLILAGYQPKKGVKLISGFGGGRKVGENYFDTAMREVLEELFEIKPNEDLLRALNVEFQPSRIVVNGNYIILQYSLDDISILTDIISRYYSHSPVYSDMPINITDLIFKRKYMKGMEVQTVLLLPFVSDFLVDGNFRKDIDIIQTYETAQAEAGL